MTGLLVFGLKLDVHRAGVLSYLSHLHIFTTFCAACVIHNACFIKLMAFIFHSVAYHSFHLLRRFVNCLDVVFLVLFLFDVVIGLEI